MSISFPYDNPTVAAYDYKSGDGACTGTGVGGVLILPYAASLYNVASVVTVLGTSTAGLKVIEAVNGTTTTAVGTFTQGTSAANTLTFLQSTGSDGTMPTATTLAAGTILQAKGVTDATGAARFSYLIKPAANASFG